MISPAAWMLALLVISTLLGLGFLGHLSATLGGAPASPAVIRIVFWGIIALGSTSLLGHVFGLAL